LGRGRRPCRPALSFSVQPLGDGYDGVHVFHPDGTRIGQIKMPEIISNVCFGGSKGNRLFMTGSQSLYALYVETRGAHLA
jgi:gluconolactonase